MDSQAQRIYTYMEVYGSITSMDAFRDLGITRLSARIKDLQDMGIEIETVMEQSKNSRYARYYIKKEQSSELDNRS